MEPLITTLALFAVSLAAQAFGGIVGNRADAVLCGTFQHIANRLRDQVPDKIPANHDIQRAVRRAFLLATITICEDCLTELNRSAKWWQAIYRTETEESRWLRDVRRSFMHELEFVDRAEYLPPTVVEDERIRVLLTPSANSLAERTAILKATLFQAVINETRRFGEPPEIFMRYVQDSNTGSSEPKRVDWFNLLSAFFLEEYKHNAVLRSAIDGSLLADLSFEMNPIDLSQFEAKLEQLSGPIFVRLDGIAVQIRSLQHQQETSFAGLESVLTQTLPQLLLLPDILQQQQELKLLIQALRLPQAQAHLKRPILSLSTDEIETIQSKRARLRALRVELNLIVEQSAQFGRVLPPALQDAIADTEQQCDIIDEEIRQELISQLSPLPFQRYSTFIGRDEEKARLLTILANREAFPMVAIDGLGGSGKTALAREIARLALEQRQFYAVVWESAKPAEFSGGRMQQISTAEINFDTLLDNIGRKLGYFDVMSCKSTDDKICYRTENMS